MSYWWNKYNYVYGTGGNDTIVTGDDNDLVYSRGGDDVINTNGGNDSVYAYYGHKKIDTGDGNDSVVAHRITDSEINTGAGHDSIYAYESSSLISTGSGNDRLTSYRSNNTIDTGTGDDYITSYYSTNTISMGDGNDRIYSVRSNDTIATGDGDDFVYLYQGRADVDLGAGNDRAYAFSAEHADIAGGAGDDFIYSAAEGTLEGGSGNDRVYGYTGDQMFIYHVDDNQNSTDYYTAYFGTDTLRVFVSYDLSVTDWFQDAMVAYQQFVDSGSGALFDFSTYGQDGFFDLKVRGMDKVEVEVFGEQTNTAPKNIMLDVSSFDENIQTGTVIAHVSSENDAGEVASYSLLDDADGLFAIDAQTGAISVTRVVDYETVQQYQLDVRVDDGNGLSTDQSFILSVNDVNENPWHVTLSNQIIAEDTVADSIIGQVSSDNDAGETVSYQLLNDFDGLFKINAQTGEISISRTVDFEERDQYQVDVRVSDGRGLTTDQQFTFEVTDVNETPWNILLSANTVAENHDDTVFAQFSSSNDAGETAHYTLLDDANGLFSIEQQTGKLYLSGQLDYETKTSHEIVVEVSDNNGNRVSQSYTIFVEDINERPMAVVLSNQTVRENLNIGDVTGVVSSMNDAGETEAYTLTDDAGGLFSINAQTGEIFLMSTLDFESATSHQISVLVTDDSGLTSSQQFTIEVSDVNENPWNVSLSENRVAENSAVGTIIGQVTSENDAGETVSYALADDAEGLFTIDSVTGEIIVNRAALDFEDRQQHTVTVNVTDSTGLSTQSDFTIDVTDVDDQPVPTTPTLTINDVSIIEGDYGVVNYMEFTIALSHASTEDVQFDYTISGLSADQALDKDFMASNGHVAITAGSTSATISVPIWGDNRHEGDETLTINLFNVQGADDVRSTAIGTIINDDAVDQNPLAAPILNSNITSENVIYIDFDGAFLSNDSYWARQYGDGTGLTLDSWSLDADNSSFDENEWKYIEEVWRKVAEDFAPFDVNVTTDADVYAATANEHKMWHVVTDTNFKGSAGVGLYNVWGRSDSDLRPSFGFFKDTTSTNFGSMIVSHEVGHGMGLYHDGYSGGDYYYGHNGWAPLMGSSYNSLTQWSQGEYNTATNKQDDIGIMNSAFGVRADDHADVAADASWLHQGDGLAATGVIETREDVDVFKIDGAFSFTFDINGLNDDRAGTNLNIMAELKNEAGEVLVRSDSTSTLNALINYDNDSGQTLYLEVSGVGHLDPLTNGYTDYGSLGHYSIDLAMEQLAEQAISAQADFEQDAGVA